MIPTSDLSTLKLRAINEFKLLTNDNIITLENPISVNKFQLRRYRNGKAVMSNLIKTLI